MDEQQSAIIYFIVISIISIYIYISILLCFLPKLLWSKKRVFYDPQQDDGEKRETEFERLVGNGVKVLEYNVEVTGDDVYVMHTDNKTVNQVASTAKIEDDRQTDDTKCNMLDKQEIRTPFENVLKSTEGKPIIIRVTEKDVNQLKKVIFHIKKKNRLDSVILGSDSKAVIHSLCKMDEYVPIYGKPDWKLYLLYFVGLLPMWPFEPSVLLISHGSVTGRLGKLRQWMFLLSHVPMIMHLRRRGIRTYIIDTGNDSYKVPGSVRLILVLDRSDLYLTPRWNQTNRQNENHKESSTDSNADTWTTSTSEKQTSVHVHQEKTVHYPSNPGHLTCTTTSLSICTRTGIAKHECSNQNEEENVSEEGNPIQTIDEGQVSSFQKKEKEISENTMEKCC